MILGIKIFERAPEERRKDVRDIAVESGIINLVILLITLLFFSRTMVKRRD